MKLLIQRVSEASVTVENQKVAQIGNGILCFVGFGAEDNAAKLTEAAQKMGHLRIFSNDAGRFHYSLLDIKGDLLLVSQFTLYADCSKGRRPDFYSSLNPEEAKTLYEQFVACCSDYCLGKVESGIFGAMMDVKLTNDGPVTIMLEF